jgi:hypothetical protein
VGVGTGGEGIRGGNAGGENSGGESTEEPGGRAKAGDFGGKYGGKCEEWGSNVISGDPGDDLGGSNLRDILGGSNSYLKSGDPCDIFGGSNFTSAEVDECGGKKSGEFSARNSGEDGEISGDFMGSSLNSGNMCETFGGYNGSFALGGEGESGDAVSGLDSMCVCV